MKTASLEVDLKVGHYLQKTKIVKFRKSIGPRGVTIMNGQEGCCSIWGTDFRATIYSGWITTKGPDIDENTLIVSGRAGGAYRITRQAHASMWRLGSREKARLTTWLINQRLKGFPEPVITDEIVESFEPKAERTDLSKAERAERLLRFIAEQTESAGDNVSIATHVYAALAWSESLEWKEVIFFLQHLENEGWISKVSVSGDYVIYVVAVTVEGFSQLDNQASNPKSMQVFVAMWFDDETYKAYTEGIEPAIRSAGYDPFRIDKVPTLEKIDNKIIEEIGRSRFLISDMTHGTEGARGSVYFEAGYAHGIGIPVIYTCRHDMFGKLHFDTRQYPHIEWKDGQLESFSRELKSRIELLIGVGALHTSSD